MSGPDRAIRHQAAWEFSLQAWCQRFAPWMPRVVGLVVLLAAAAKAHLGIDLAVNAPFVLGYSWFTVLIVLTVVEAAFGVWLLIRPGPRLITGSVVVFGAMIGLHASRLLAGGGGDGIRTLHEPSAEDRVVQGQTQHVRP